MATAKKAAPKAAKAPQKVAAPAKVEKAVPKKALVSKTAKAIAKLSASIVKLTERKNKINAEINTLRDQRAALKAPAAPAPAAPAPVAVAPVTAPKKAKAAAK